MLFDFILETTKTFLTIVGVNEIALRSLNLTMHREAKNGYVISSFPHEETESLINLKNNVDFKRVKELVPYFKVLLNQTKKQNLQVILRNLNDVKIKRVLPNIFSGAIGSYDYRANKLKYATKQTIAHEFLHLASSYYDKENDVGYSGFSQNKRGKFPIGDGLDEGYTELLATRWFIDKEKKEQYFKDSGYKTLVTLASLFEYFFPNPKDMEDYYFNHNLPGFIEYMSRFASRKEIIEILVHMDNICLRKSFLLSFPTLDGFKATMKLYSIFKRNCKDPYKLAAFEQQICTNPLIRFAFNHQNLKLYRDNPYVSMNNEGKRKNI